MKLIFLAYKNMVSKPLNLMLSALLLMLSVSLVTFVLQLNKQLEGQLDKNIAPFDMVVGAKGSPLQLVLSSVLHLDAPTGNIKLKETAFIKKHPFVRSAVSVSYGDNYKGYRILGTEIEYLTYYNAELASGELYNQSFELVAGSNVAKRLGLKIGDEIISAHGFIASDDASHDEHPYVLKGILKPTGTVIDQLLIGNLESIWAAHDHDEPQAKDVVENDQDHDEEQEEHHDDDDEHEHDDHEGDHEHDDHEDDREITSLLVKFKNPLGMVQLPRFINENTNLQTALPGFEVQRLTKLFGAGIQTINGIAIAILLVSGLSIFISLLKTIRERRSELALLRTYGLRTRQLLWLVILEGIFLAFLGFVLGWILGRLGILGISEYMQRSYGYTLTVNGPEIFELFLLGIIFGVAILATLLASLSIFKLNVAKTLSDV